MDGRSGKEPRNGAGEGRSAAGRRQDHGVPRDPGSRQVGLHWAGPRRDGRHSEVHRPGGADLPGLCRRRVPAEGRPERGHPPVHGTVRRSRVRLGAVPLRPVLLVVLSSSRSLHQDMNA